MTFFLPKSSKLTYAARIASLQSFSSPLFRCDRLLGARTAVPPTVGDINTTTTIGAALSFLKSFFIGKVKVLRRNKSFLFSRFPPDVFPPPAHLANFVVKWPSPPAPAYPTLENQYWFLSFSRHHYRFFSSLLSLSRSSILGRLASRSIIQRQRPFSLIASQRHRLVVPF